MSQHCHRRATCRLCGARDLALVLQLTPTPPANAFVPASALGTPQEVFPLDVFFCRSCGHVQLLDVVDPRILFENYVYVSGTSPAFVAHFQRYAADMIALLGLKPGDLVVDIGSNDGTLLRFFKEAGMRVLGVDPAKQIAAEATAAGLPTIADFFTPELAARIAAEHGAASLITANNMFAHADALDRITDGIAGLLKPGGAFVFEVSYLVDVFQKTLFDTIYHEHVAYHTVKPLIPFFRRHGLEMTDAIRVPSHGGSLRGIARKPAGGVTPAANESLRAAVAAEEVLGLDREATLAQFGRQIDQLKQDLVSLLRRLKAEGKSIAGFGAPAKATTLMYHFGLGPDIVDFIIDDSPLKQHLFTPGLHVPVLPASVLAERKPDYLVLLAWNFAKPIMDKNPDYRAAGGHFIVPVPRVEVF